MIDPKKPPHELEAIGGQVIFNIRIKGKRFVEVILTPREARGWAQCLNVSATKADKQLVAIEQARIMGWPEGDEPEPVF